MQTTDQLTCGKGLAENSGLPAQAGKLIAAMAEILETHMKALDLTDKNSEAEFVAYEKLVRELKDAALQLHITARQMAGYRELPMGKHDEKVLRQPVVIEGFERFIQQKQELLSLLEQTTARDHATLDAMRAYSP